MTINALSGKKNQPIRSLKHVPTSIQHQPTFLIQHISDAIFSQIRLNVAKFLIFAKFFLEYGQLKKFSQSA